MKKITRALSRIGIALLLQGATVSAQSTLITRPEALRQDPRRTTIGFGDLLLVSIFDEPQLSGVARVGSDGTIRLSLLGEIKVSGMTTEAAAVYIQDLLLSRKLLLKPAVTVMISQYATAGVSIEGEVEHPGSYTLLGDHTLLDAISSAGGLKSDAGGKVLIKRRGTDGSVQTVTLDLENGEATTRSDIPVFANDLIVVPRTGIVYVLGSVTKPGGFTMRSDGRMTLMQVIAQALGTTKSASLSNVRVLHRRPDGTTSTSVLHLNKIEQGKQEDVELYANDVVVVPGSALKDSTAMLAGLGGAVATALIYTLR